METRYCYACHCNGRGDVKMVFYPNKSIYGAYECPNSKCGHKVDKKTAGNTGEKYI